MTVRKFILPVEAVGATPTWFASLAPFVWDTVAHGANAANRAVATTDARKQGQNMWEVHAHTGGTPPCNFPADSAGSSASNILTNWTGAAMDLDRNQLLLTCNGGHAGYWGNETYAVSLKLETPRCYRLTDPTPYRPGVDERYWSPADSNMEWYTNPNDNLLEPDRTAYYEQVFKDGPAGSENRTPGWWYQGIGRPHAGHTANTPVYADGRIWMLTQSATTNYGGGGGSGCTFAFNRAAHYAAHANNCLPHTNVNIFPWEKYENVYQKELFLRQLNPSYGFETAAYDTLRKKIWSWFAPDSLIMWSVDTVGADLGKIRLYRYNPTFYGSNIWSVYVPEFDVTILACAYNQNVHVIRMNQLGAGSLTTTTTIPDAAVSVHPTTPTMLWWDHDPTSMGAFRGGAHAVYHAQTRSIIAFDRRTYEPGQDGNTEARLRVLRLPMSGSTFNPAGAWVWQNIVPTGTPPQVCAAGYYSKFNAIPNFDGSGNMLVVALGSNAGVVGGKCPVHVLKVPANF